MSRLALVLGAARSLIGVGSWLAPDHTARFFGIDPARSDRFIARLFGAREIALGASLLTASPGNRAAAAAVGVAVDAVDAIAGFSEHRRGNLSTRSLILGPVGAVGFVALGALAVREASASPASA